MPVLSAIKILHLQHPHKRQDPTSQLLRKAGFEVVEAATAVAAFSRIDQRPPDLILLEEKLEDLTALEICRALKAKARSIPILLLSAGTENNEMQQAQELKDLADACLYSPLDAAELTATIKALVRLRKAASAFGDALLFEGNRLPAFIFDKASQMILAVNEAAVQHYEYSRQQLQAMTMKALHPAAEATRWDEYVAALPHVANPQPWHHQKPDGSLIEVETIWQELRFRGRNAILAMVKDITSQMQAAAALKASEQRFRLLADTAPTMIWVCGPDKMCTFINQSRLDFTGHKLEQELGNGWTANIHPDDLDRVLEIYTTFSDAREPFTMDYRLRRHDGEYRWILDKGVPRFSDDGDFEGYIGNCIDITDRKMVEGEREYLLNREQRARAEAEAANRAKDEFLAVVSHELRAPLNAMLGWSRILQSKQVDQATQTMALETIERSARMQAQIIEDLLDTARIISGKLRLDVQPVNVAPVIKTAIDIMRPAAEAKDIAISISLYSESDVITGDAARLQQVVWNLVSNAIKFTPRGGGVEVLLERVDPYLQIVVRDTGQGIKPEMIPHVFDRFYQVDKSSTRRYSGLGLGLSLVRHLVELHGGTIGVESAGENQGAVFTVKLPLRAVRSPLHKQENPAPPANLMKDLNLRLDDLWVLAVDDEQDARELLTTLLKQHGAKVTPVASASAAFEAIIECSEGSHPDIIVSDIGMPDEDGYSLLKRIRQLAPECGGHIPAVALTAYGRATDRVQALAAGFQSHVPKPVDLTELIMVIASLTKRDVKGGVTQAQGENFRQ